jgi:hypothetical protein
VLTGAACGLHAAVRQSDAAEPRSPVPRRNGTGRWIVEWTKIAGSIAFNDIVGRRTTLIIPKTSRFAIPTSDPGRRFAGESLLFCESAGTLGLLSDLELSCFGQVDGNRVFRRGKPVSAEAAQRTIGDSMLRWTSLLVGANPRGKHSGSSRPERRSKLRYTGQRMSHGGSYARRLLLIALVLCATVCAQSASLTAEQETHHADQHCCGLCHMGPAPVLPSTASAIGSPCFTPVWFTASHDAATPREVLVTSSPARAPPA